MKWSQQIVLFLIGATMHIHRIKCLDHFKVLCYCLPYPAQQTGLLIYSNLWRVIHSRPSNELHVFHKPENYKRITNYNTWNPVCIRTLAVAMSGKPQASFQVVKNNLFLKVCIKFEYVSKPVYLTNLYNPQAIQAWFTTNNVCIRTRAAPEWGF